MEQPAGLLRKMRQVNNIYRACKQYKNEGAKPGESAKWKKEHAELWDIVAQVDELRNLHG